MQEPRTETTMQMLKTTDIPAQYKPWVSDSTIKSQIKTIYKKFKDTKTTDEIRESNTKIMLGPNGEVYRIESDRVEIYDWLPSYGEFEPYQLCLKHTFVCDEAITCIPLKYDNKSNHAIALFVTIMDKFIIKISGSKLPIVLDLTYYPGHEYVPKIITSAQFYAFSDITADKTYIFNARNGFGVYYTIPTTIFDIKGDYLIYKSDNQQTTTKLSISSNKGLANKLINAMVDIVKDLKDGTADYKEILIDAYNTITKQTEYVECVDLLTKDTLFRVGLPSGVSNLSLANNDLTFVSVSNRGDELHKWDYSQLQQHESVVLVDRQVRGQTATIIKSVQLSNNHILCVNDNTGSVHYLGNYGWKLSKIKALEAKLVKTHFIEDFIVMVDINMNLLIVSTKGKLITFIAMDQKPTIIDTTVSEETKLDWKYEHMEIDVDTCGAYPFLFMNKNCTFTKVTGNDSITPSMLSSL